MIVRNSTSPMMNPVLRPMAMISTTKTMVTALARLNTNSLVASATASGWKLISPISMPIGWLPLSCVELFPQGLAHRHDVAAGHGGDAEADGRLAVVAEQPPRRVLIAALDRRDVAEAELAARLVRADHQIEHLIGGGEGARRIERDVLVADADAAAVGGDVPLLELAVDQLLVEAQLRQPLPRDFEEDDLPLLAKERDALDARHLEKFAAQKLDVAAQLREREALARHGEEDAIHVAEIVDDHRLAAHRGRQLRPARRATLRRSSSQTCGMRVLS